jgi:prepilin-type N-terminal cleavage/methylation domain-containing protein
MSPLLRTRARSGFTLIETVVVVTILGLAAAVAIPSITQWSANQRLLSSARVVGATLSQARGEAVRSGNIHLVFFGMDNQGNPLVDPDGTVVDMLVVDDGLPGALLQNCLVDANEAVVGHSLEANITPGQAVAVGKVPTDAGAGDETTGTSFTDAGGNPANWVMFRPDGAVETFSNDCTTGGIGSGGGAVYLNNGARDMAMVISPLGANRVYSWDVAAGGWRD